MYYDQILLNGVIQLKIFSIIRQAVSTVLSAQVVQPVDLKLLREGAEKHAEHIITLPKDLDELDIFGTNARFATGS